MPTGTRGDDAREAGADTRSRWAVFATFDAAGACRSPAVEQVRAYRGAGFEVLVVDSSPVRAPEREAAWAREASAWFARANAGYDFGSYAAGLAWLAGRGVAFDRTTLLLANDSCFGPYRPLAPILAGFDATDPAHRTVFGISDSVEHRRHHLQSYWLYLRPNVAPLAAAYIASVAPTIAGRGEAVWRGELGLSEHLLQQGCRLRALLPADETLAHFAGFRGRWGALVELAVRLAIRRPRYSRRTDAACILRLLGHPAATVVLRNTMLAFGVVMLREGMTPFVKRALLRDNQLGDPLVPPGLDAEALDNASVAALLGGVGTAGRPGAG